MHELLHYPAVQAGLAPFLVALVAAELFLRARLSGLALIAGFAATVYLSADFHLEPLTLSHKLIWLGLGGAVFGLLLGILEWAWLSVLLIPVAGSIAVWLTWPMLRADALPFALMSSSGLALFMIALTWAMDSLHNTPLRAANAATALALATGVSVYGSLSAMYGQFIFAMAAGAAAHLLIQMIASQALSAGRSFTLPAALVSGGVACIAVLNGHLPWYCLSLLAAIPLAAWLMPLPKLTPLMQSLALSLATFGLAAGAVYLSGFRFAH